MLLQRYVLNFIIFAVLICLRCESKHNFKKNVRRKITAKVVGGTPVDIAKFPYAVQFLNAGIFCGGVIIHSWAIITAAHCFTHNKNIDGMVIQAGGRYFYDVNATKYGVIHYVIHKEFQKQSTFSYDIALVFPKTAFIFGRDTKKAMLVNHDKWMDKKERSFAVMGWGRTEENGQPSKVGLQMAVLRYIPRERCFNLYQNALTSDMFCLYGNGERDPCKGDSGGGVIWNDMLVGITSHSKGCARKRRPAVFVNVFLMKDWINSTLRGFYSSFCKGKLTTTTPMTTTTTTTTTTQTTNNNISLEIFL